MEAHSNLWPYISEPDISSYPTDAWDCCLVHWCRARDAGLHKKQAACMDAVHCIVYKALK